MRPLARQNMRAYLMKQQGKRCIYCNVRMTLPCGDKDRLSSDATFEHLRPVSQGGTWHKDNIALACHACNNARGDTPIHVFKAQRAASVDAP